jgi:hypothetical protein
VLIPIRINGLEESPISDVTISNVNIKNAKRTSTFNNCTNISLKDVFVNEVELKIAK